MKKTIKHLRIIGTRGVPAQHGGFETFAQECALYMEQRGWKVTVYCQQEGSGGIVEDYWREIRRVTISVSGDTPLSTMNFDWQVIKHAMNEDGVILCLGYNTAVFNLRLRLKKIPLIINMDGIEWKREKWSLPAKLWLYINEKAGLHFSDHLIADNPGIAEHLKSRFCKAPLTTIPYGAPLLDGIADDHLSQFKLVSNEYILLIARPEPENSILEIVQAFTSSNSNIKLAVLGNYSVEHPYQKRVLDTANDNVYFLGAIYDQKIVAALRYHCYFYVHGHTVGGTNPSLVEAMGSANAILAHGNIFNRWVTGPDAAHFFTDMEQCKQEMEKLLSSPETIVEMKQASRRRFLEAFTWAKVLREYKNCFDKYVNEDNNT